MFEVQIIHLTNTSDGHNKYYNLMAISSKNTTGRGFVVQNWGALGRKGAGYGKTFYETSPYVFDFHFVRKSDKKIGEGYTVTGTLSETIYSAEELRNYIVGTKLSGVSFVGVMDADAFEIFVEDSEGSPSHSTSTEWVAAKDDEADIPTMKDGILLAHGEDCQMRGSW